VQSFKLCESQAYVSKLWENFSWIMRSLQELILHIKCDRTLCPMKYDSFWKYSDSRWYLYGKQINETAWLGWLCLLSVITNSALCPFPSFLPTCWLLGDPPPPYLYIRYIIYALIYTHTSRHPSSCPSLSFCLKLVKEVDKCKLKYFCH
jgi:hypothetical protein